MWNRPQITVCLFYFFSLETSSPCSKSSSNRVALFSLQRISVTCQSILKWLCVYTPWVSGSEVFCLSFSEGFPRWRIFFKYYVILQGFSKGSLGVIFSKSRHWHLDHNKALKCCVLIFVKLAPWKQITNAGMHSENRLGCLYVTGNSLKFRMCDVTFFFTGSTQAFTRKEIWSSKRVLFLTPQVMVNDLSRGACPAAEIKCLVIDEAHKALGNYAYCQVILLKIFYSVKYCCRAFWGIIFNDGSYWRHYYYEKLYTYYPNRWW